MAKKQPAQKKRHPEISYNKQSGFFGGKEFTTKTGLTLKYMVGAKRLGSLWHGNRPFAEVISFTDEGCYLQMRTPTNSYLEFLYFETLKFEEENNY